MDKWTELRHLINATLSYNVQYSHDRDYEHGVYKSILRHMDYLDEKEKVSRPMIPEAPKEGFVFTGVPTFDQRAWEKIMEEKGLQGLS